MEKVLVTVLMPVYNAEKYLAEAIDSILNQTLTAFEFIIVDDGSTDNSIDIISSYSDPRIKLVRNEVNMGISATLNKGISLASTALIARMDADDISYPRRLERQYENFSSNPGCALLASWVRVVSEDGKEIRTEKYQRRFYYYNMTFSCWIYHPAVMYRKNAVVDVGGYSTPYGEDYDLFWKLLRKYRFDVLEEVLVDYRVTPQSLHQVTRKAEYDAAMQEQVMRNIRYYAGDAFHLSHEELRCLQFDFAPDLSLYALAKVFKKLKLITNAIATHPNANLDPQAVVDAWYFKRGFMISALAKRFTRFKMVMLKLALRLI